MMHKHYNITAKVFREQLESASKLRAEQKDRYSKAVAGAMVATLEVTIRSMADRYAKHDEEFDKEKWIKQCSITTTK